MFSGSPTDSSWQPEDWTATSICLIPSSEGPCECWQGTGVKIWDARTGKLERSLAVDDSADVGFSPDGRYLVTSSGREFCFWDVGTWNKALSYPRTNAGAMPG